MLRMSRIVLTVAFCALPSLAWGQLNGPAPAEPTAASGSETSESAETPKKYNKAVDEETAPIPNTEPAVAGDAAELQAEIKTLKQQLADLKAQLESLQANYDELEIAVGDHKIAIDAHAEGFTKLSDDVTRNAQKITSIQSEQQKLAGQMDDMADSSVTRSAAKVPGDMQDNAASKEELLRNTRYRLRIHNTTGVEQPLSINGSEWLVLADEWSYVPIPQGPVTVRRANYDPLVIAGQADQWQQDDRGFHIDYDLDGHQVEESESP